MSNRESQWRTTSWSFAGLAVLSVCAVMGNWAGVL